MVMQLGDVTPTPGLWGKFPLAPICLLLWLYAMAWLCPSPGQHFRVTRVRAWLGLWLGWCW